MTEEYLDILDEKGNPTGKIKLRSEVHRDGDWHREVFVFSINSRNQVLMQLRSPNKISHPNQWDVAAAGHASTGDSGLTAAIREIKEEIGQDIEDRELKHLFDMNRQSIRKDKGIKNSAIYDIYLLKKDIDLSKIKLQEEEVSDVKYIEIDDLKSALNNSDPDFVFRSFYPKLFAILENK